MLIFGVLTAESDSYSVPVLIFLAFYALFGLISASVGAFKSRRDNIPIHRAAYSVRLASGALSLFNLVSAVTESYAYNERTSEAVCVLLGAAVSLLVLYLSFSMIFSAVKTERRI